MVAYLVFHIYIFSWFKEVSGRASWQAIKDGVQRSA